MVWIYLSGEAAVAAGCERIFCLEAFNCACRSSGVWLFLLTRYFTLSPNVALMRTDVNNEWMDWIMWARVQRHVTHPAGPRSGDRCAANRKPLTLSSDTTWTHTHTHRERLRNDIPQSVDVGVKRKYLQFWVKRCWLSSYSATFSPPRILEDFCLILLL